MKVPATEDRYFGTTSTKLRGALAPKFPPLNGNSTDLKGISRRLPRLLAAISATTVDQGSRGAGIFAIEESTKWDGDSTVIYVIFRYRERRRKKGTSAEGPVRFRAGFRSAGRTESHGDERMPHLWKTGVFREKLPYRREVGKRQHGAR